MMYSIKGCSDKILKWGNCIGAVSSSWLGLINLAYFVVRDRDEEEGEEQQLFRNDQSTNSYYVWKHYHESWLLLWTSSLVIFIIYILLFFRDYIITTLHYTNHYDYNVVSICFDFRYNVGLIIGYCYSKN